MNDKWPMTEPSNMFVIDDCGCGEDFVYQIDGKFGAQSQVCMTCGYVKECH